MSLRGQKFTVGQPPDDPTCNLTGNLYLPDTTIWGPGPYPGIVATVANTFKGGGNNASDRPLSDFSDRGYICMFGDVRLMKPPSGIQGQTTDGRYSQQQDDLKIHVRYMRNHPLCVGFVGSLGGSGSGHHALWVAITGTVGDDRADACAALSPVTDMGDRDPDMTAQFIAVCEDYQRGETDVNILTAHSPVGIMTAPIPPIIFCNGTLEHGGTSGMPYSQFLKFKAALDAMGVTTYFARTNVTQEHSWVTWPETGPDCIDFMDAAYLAWQTGGGTPPPPPPRDTGFRLTLTGGSYTIVGAETGGILPLEARDATITNLTPNTAYRGYLSAFTPLGESEKAIYDFTTPAGENMKDLPCGTYHLLTATNGNFWTGLGSEATLAFPYIIGYRGRSTIAVVEPTTAGVYVWDAPSGGIDSAVAVCTANNKELGISIAVGVSANALWYDTGGSTEVQKIAIDLADITPQAYQPVFWDPAHLTKMQALINAFAAKYDADPTVSYIVVGGFMQNNEAYVSKTALDDAKWDQSALDFGFANKLEAYASAAQTIIGYYLAAFQQTVCFFTTAKVFAGPDGNTARSALEAWIIANTGHRCGIMSAQQKASLPPHAAPTMLAYPRGGQAIAASSSHSNFYMGGTPSPYPDVPQPVDDLLKEALTEGLNFVEIYNGDARDPLNETVITDNNALLCAQTAHDTPVYIKGVWGLFGAGQDTITPELQANLGIVGLNVGVDWSDVEKVSDGGNPDNAVYDFSKLITKINDAKAKGFQHINASVTWSQVATPAWLKAELLAMSPPQALVMRDPGHEGTTYCTEFTVPIYWSSRWHEKRLRLIAELGKILNPDPAINAVFCSFLNHRTMDWNTFDSQQTLTNCPPGTCPAMDGNPCDIAVDQPAQWNAAGWTKALVIQVGKELIAAAAAAFPDKCLKLPIGGMHDELAQFTRAVTNTSGSANVAMPQAEFLVGDVGKLVTGKTAAGTSCITAGTTILSRTDSSHVVLSAPTTGDCTKISLIERDPDQRGGVPGNYTTIFTEILAWIRTQPFSDRLYVSRNTASSTWTVPPTDPPGFGGEQYIKYALGQEVPLCGLQTVTSASQCSEGTGIPCRLNGNDPTTDIVDVMQRAMNGMLGFGPPTLPEYLTFIEAWYADAKNPRFYALTEEATIRMGGQLRVP